MTLLIVDDVRPCKYRVLISDDKTHEKYRIVKPPVSLESTAEPCGSKRKWKS